MDNNLIIDVILIDSTSSQIIIFSILLYRI
jgi:hypothetical protein